MPELFLGRVGKGHPVEVAAWAARDRPIPGEIDDLDSRIDPVSRSFIARARVANADDAFRPGMSFAVTLDAHGKRYPLVPEISVRYGTGGAFVWVVREDAAVRVPVRIVERQEAAVLVDAAVARVAGVKEVRSSSEEDNFRIRVVFSPDTELDSAANDVREAVGRVERRLPEAVEQLTVIKADADAYPVIRLAASSATLSEEALTRIVEKYIVPALISVDGVATVNLFGDRERTLRVVVDPLRLTSFGLAVVATTLTLVSVFTPISFLPSTAGRLFREFGFVLAIAVIISSFVALSLVPALAARLPEGAPARRGALTAFGRWLAELYARTLRLALHAPLVAGALALALAFGTFAWTLFGALDEELVPPEDRGALHVRHRPRRRESRLLGSAGRAHRGDPATLCRARRSRARAHHRRALGPESRVCHGASRALGRAHAQPAGDREGAARRDVRGARRPRQGLESELAGMAREQRHRHRGGPARHRVRAPLRCRPGVRPGHRGRFPPT